MSTWKLCSEKKVIIYVGTTEHSFIIYYRLVRLWAEIYSRKFSFINYASRDEILAKPLTQGRLVFAFGTSLPWQKGCNLRLFFSGITIALPDPRPPWNCFDISPVFKHFPIGSQCVVVRLKETSNQAQISRKNGNRCNREFNYII